MERLTEWTGYAWIPVQERQNGKLIGHKDCMERLAAYEDTGLTPEQMRQIDGQFREQARELMKYRSKENQVPDIVRCRECAYFGTADGPLACDITAQDDYCSYGRREKDTHSPQTRVNGP